MTRVHGYDVINRALIKVTSALSNLTQSNPHLVYDLAGRILTTNEQHQSKTQTLSIKISVLRARLNNQLAITL